MNYTIPLSQLEKSNIATAGGKGANLGEMVRAGFPVPPGFVLTTAAYDAFVDEQGLRQQVVDLAASVAADDWQAAEAAAGAIQALFLDADMPGAIRADLLSAYTELTADGDTAVAVRSSATAEDLPTASFAGQQDSFLNVQGETALVEAVKKCWASLWTARAISYRQRQGIDPATVSLAVVVQRFVPADAAGILFTANPVDGDRDQIVINATWGLGEAIVGGQVTPDTVVVDKPTRDILTRETAAKTVMTVATAGGTEAQPVPDGQQRRQVIDNATALELARFGVELEAHFGLPLDIEWAVAGGQIAILQARPITKLPPPPLRDVRWEPPRPGTLWMRRQVVEHMPEPLSPLFDELYLENGLDYSLESMAEFMSDMSGIDINMRAFFDRPFATSVNGYAYSIASFKFSWRLIPVALRIYVTVLPKMLRHLIPHWRNQSLPAYLATIAAWKDVDLAAAPDELLLQGVRELAREDAVYWFASAMPLGVARMSDGALDRFLKSAARANGARVTSGALLRGFPSKTVEAQAHLEAIARRIHASASLPEQVLDTPAPRLPDLLAEHPEVMAAFQQYLDAYGHQIYNLDFVAPTLADDPLPVLLSLKTAVAHPERDVRMQQTRLAHEREELAAWTERALNPLLRPIFRLLLGWAQRFAPDRELALFYVGAAWPALRRLALELGRRLTTAGSLAAPGDVFYLRSGELAEASAARAQDGGRPDLAQLAQERRELRQARMRLDPPISVPPDGHMKFGPIDMGALEPRPRGASSGPTLDGFAVSPGQVTAPASVVRTPEAFDEMAADTILVCPTTTPAWTPLFARAKGLVTDIGGALAHGSIVAREYGIPAVMGTGNATKRIESGQLIRVDGDNGTVTLVDEAGAEAIAPEEAAPEEAAAGSPARKVALAALVAAAAAGLFLWWRRRR